MGTFSAASSEDVLAFWFKGIDQHGVPSHATVELWFSGSPDVDSRIREGFLPTIEAAVRGALDGWAAHPRDRLALVIVLDQFTRNAYRGTPAAFSGDVRALAQTLMALDTGEHLQLQPIERNFLYMPLEHAEDAAMQARAVQLYEDLLEDAALEARSTYEEALLYARQHEEIIDRFGRFPHRNEILGRKSTEEEMAYLQGGGTRFG